MVRQLKAPFGFKAKLPFGPPTKAVDEDDDIARKLFAGKSTKDVQIDEQFPKLIALIEDQLTAISGIDQSNADKHKGRAEGPSLVWRCAVSIASGASRIT